MQFKFNCYIKLIFKLILDIQNVVFISFKLEIFNDFIIYVVRKVVLHKKYSSNFNIRPCDRFSVRFYIRIIYSARSVFLRMRSCPYVCVCVCFPYAWDLQMNLVYKWKMRIRIRIWIYAYAISEKYAAGTVYHYSIMNYYGILNMMKVSLK